MSSGSSSNAPLILVLGILGMLLLIGSCVFSPLILPAIALGIVGWLLGLWALRAIDAGEGNPQDRGLVMVGYILSIITTILGSLAICFVVLAVLGVLALFGFTSWQSLRP